MKQLSVASLALAAFALAACGNTTEERALTGGGIGAAGGAAAGAITDVGVGTGALIGGAVGAATGALTDEDDINLGDPFWNRDGDNDEDNSDDNNLF